MTTTERSTAAAFGPSSDGGEGRTAVFLDLDTVLLATHPGRYGPELGIQADIAEAIGRFSETTDAIVVLVSPLTDVPHSMDTPHRVDVLRQSLGSDFDRLIVEICEHG